MRVVRGDATHLPLADESVHCVVTSPPYNVGIEYHDYDDHLPWSDYFEMAQRSSNEMDRVLVPGGRAWVNVMPSVPVEGVPARLNLGRLWAQALHDAGLHYRDTVIWKQDSHDGGTAWGSWLRPSAPNLRGSYEIILCVFKHPYKRTPPDALKGWQAPREELGGDWTDLCRNVWELQPARPNNDAPAPFPIELPARAIRLSTWPGEVVLDPFAGSGTSLRAASNLGRVGVGIDIGVA